MNGSTIIASTMEAARTQFPEGTPAEMNTFDATSRPTKPNTTDGMPASRSIAERSAPRTAALAAHDRNSAEPSDTTNAIASASAETTMVAAMKFAIPYDAPKPKSMGIHSWPSKNSRSPTSETTGAACTATVAITATSAATANAASAPENACAKRSARI